MDTGKNVHFRRDIYSNTAVRIAVYCKAWNSPSIRCLTSYTVCYILCIIYALSVRARVAIRPVYSKLVLPSRKSLEIINIKIYN